MGAEMSCLAVGAQHAAPLHFARPLHFAGPYFARSRALTAYIVALMSASAPATDRWGDRLPRRLGLWSAVAVLVGSTIGGGIFRTPAIIAERVPGPRRRFGVWILGGLLALCGALTYAELAALFPRSGGVYVYVREGFGRLPAFLFGWTELVLIRASALGAIATPFAEYFLRSLGFDPTHPPYDAAVHWVAALAIVGTATLNFVGVRWSSLVL